ncbi:hypothetical protein E2C01_056855 [Portunus trituberculatus]|uniref:Uncharacterized protein n=1 Tax=Portunus trituberculatus TaxID=210409 RepID=A0A5B7GZC6_PORTR|nr:hypothetical protein [Portunus trituberculatus]
MMDSIIWLDPVRLRSSGDGPFKEGESRGPGEEKGPWKW